MAVDAKSVETDVKNVIFYYEEKISETAFVPHELRELPVKRGTATVKSSSMALNTSISSPAAVRHLVSQLRSTTARRASSLWPSRVVSKAGPNSGKSNYRLQS